MRTKPNTKKHQLQLADELVSICAVAGLLEERGVTGTHLEASPGSGQSEDFIIE